MAIIPQYQPVPDLELHGPQTYRAIAAGTGYAIDDIIIRTDVIDPNTGDPTGETVWFNKTQQTFIDPAPLVADLESVDGASPVKTWKKVETDLATGLEKEIIQVQLFDQNGLPDGAPYYLDPLTGLAYVPTGTVEDSVVRVSIGSETISAVDGATAATLTPIANARHAEVHITGSALGTGAIFTLDGATAPNAVLGQGFRVNDGATFELQSASEMANFQGISLSATDTVTFYVEYFNIQKHN